MIDLARRWLPLLIIVPATFVAAHMATEWWTARSTRLVAPPVVVIPALAGTTAVRQDESATSGGTRQSSRSQATGSRSDRPSGATSATRKTPRASRSSVPAAKPRRAGEAAPDEPFTLDPITDAAPEADSPTEEVAPDVP